MAPVATKNFAMRGAMLIERDRRFFHKEEYSIRMETGAIIALLLKYRYWIIFPVACIEGPVLSFLIGVLSGFGYFNPFLAYPILILGDLIPDTILYYIGTRGNRAQFFQKYAPKIGITEAHFGVLQDMWDTHPRKTTVMSKLAIGLSSPLLVSAGLAGVPARIFYSMVIPVTLLQHVVFLTAGYHLGNSFALVEKYLGHAEFFVGLVAIFALAYYLFGVYMKRRFVAYEDAEKKHLGIE